MTLAQRLRQWRDWFPVPTRGRLRLARWVLLEGNRLAVTAALLALVYVIVMLTGTVWTFEMQQILTETSTVENILDTFLGGIILLVSIVVSINSIVLSQDITSVGTQEDRIQGVMEFRREIGQLTESGESPSHPAAFLEMMATVISERARALTDSSSGDSLAAGENALTEEAIEEIRAYADSITETIEQFEDIDDARGAEFGVLWRALEIEYGPHMDRSHALRSSYEESLPESFDERLDRLVEAFELFAIGEEYFKTLYYTREVSRLSRALLVVSLPAILITATSILAINAEILPDIWVLGLPPLQSFVAAMFTISLAPYVVLTSYMLRLSTVATRAASGGLFSLR